MNFLSPEALAFAAALPVVIVFYLLKRKRVVKLISSTLLWQKFLAETQANAPFQRLRHNWLLVLQLLLLALVVFALTRPFLTGNSKNSRLRVLILDASASMQSTDEKPSRFEKARTEALKWVDGMADNDQLAVFLVGAQTEVKQSATSDKQALRRVLKACEPADSPTRITEALKLAQTLIRDHDQRGNPEIHLFSDGALPNLGEFENQTLPLVYHRVGQRGFNLGITSLDVRANPDNATQRAIFTSVINPMTNEAKTGLELRFDNQVLEVRLITIPPTNTFPLVFLAAQPRDGVFTVRLTTPDDLAADNQASIISLLPQPVKVLLVTRGNRFLEKALRGAPNVQLTTASLLADAAPGYDLVVLDDLTPLVWPAGNTLAIHVSNTNWFPEISRVEAPPIVDWRNTHPLLRFVNFDNVQVAESLAVKSPGWGVSLVDSPQTPLLVAGEIDRRRVIWIGFDPLQSTWPLRISFPIFIANAVEWLNPSGANASQFTVKAGEPFRLRLTQPPGPTAITRPDGTVREIVLETSSREILFGDTTRNGLYRLKTGTNEITFCVNLMDAAESDTRPRDGLPCGKYGNVTTATVKRANLELWRWIAAAGLLVLMFEWWWYHKRTA